MIEINNLTIVEIDQEEVKNITEKVLEKEGKRGDISIAFVGQGRIKVLNKKYRKKNRATDVLAFSQNSKFPILDASNLGEIIICLSEVKKNAKKFNSSFKEELARVLIHGVLHLLGYEHEKNAEATREMEEKQEEYLSQIKF